MFFLKISFFPTVSGIFPMSLMKSVFKFQSDPLVGFGVQEKYPLKETFRRTDMRSVQKDADYGNQDT